VLKLRKKDNPGCSFSDQMPKFFTSFVEVDQCQFDHNLILAQRRINNLPMFFDHNLALATIW